MLVVERFNAGVHRAHPVLSPGLQDGLQLLGGVLADEIAHRRSRDHDLTSQDPSWVLGAWQQLLRDHALQAI